MKKKKPGKKIRKNPRKYTDAEKRAVCLEYYLTGSMRAVERNTKIPRSTMIRWKNEEEWWGESILEFREDYSDELEAGFGEIMRLAHKNIKKGLTEGDEKLVFNRATEQYETHLVKPSAKDSAVIQAVGFDKLRITLNKPTSITGTTQGQIEDLAKTFRELSASFEEKKVNSIEGEYEDKST